MIKKRQPQWQFTIDLSEAGESWRWIHIDARGDLQHSASCFSGFDGCAANAKQYGWPGLKQPTILKRANARASASENRALTVPVAANQEFPPQEYK